MNIHISRSMVVTTPTGIEKMIEENFDCIQTPTNISYQIINSENPIESYKNWVIENYGEDETFAIYAEDDPFGEKEPIRYSIINDGKEHNKRLNYWLQESENEGYEVEIEVW